jgi:F-type H+-transporting ATPase subunit epsilon
VAVAVKLSVYTAESQLYAGDADFVVVPAVEGELGILPRHSPLVALLKPGELRYTHGGEEDYFFVSGGFVNVAREGDATAVTVLADTGERAHDIDEARAAEARRRAQEMLQQRLSAEEYADAAALLARASQRVRVAEVARRRRSTTHPRSASISRAPE